MSDTRVAAIDCGTNSIRLLVADPPSEPGGELVDLARRMEIVRLGQGVDRTGRLAPEAIERTRVALAEYAEQLGALGAGRVRMVATSATRDAANAADFRDMVRATLGVDPEVITGAQEARLSFTGAVRGLPDAQLPYLVCDIGGGSTELVLGAGAAGMDAGPGDAAASAGSGGAGPDGDRDGAGSAGAGSPDGDGIGGAGTDSGGVPVAAYSMDVGCVRLTERHLRDDPPTAAQVAAAEADVRAALAVAREHVPVERAATFVGVAGSVTTVAALALALPEYDSTRTHHARLPAVQVAEVTGWLLRSTHAERAARAVIHPGRVDVIGTGALILRVLMAELGVATVVVSEHDILDGLALSLG